MTILPHPPNVAPDNLGDFAKVARDELRKGGFGRNGRKPPRRPKRPGLLLLIGLIVFAVAFIALCDNGGTQIEPDSGTPAALRTPGAGATQ